MPRGRGQFVRVRVWREGMVVVARCFFGKGQWYGGRNVAAVDFFCFMMLVLGWGGFE